MTAVGYNAQPIDLLIDEAYNRPDKWAVFHDHFLTFDSSETNTKSWVVDNATAGTADVIDAVGGQVELDSASTTQFQGVQMQLASESFQASSGKRVIFDCRVKITDAPADALVFAGLGELNTGFMSSGLVAEDNYVGFVMDTAVQATDAAELFFNAEKGGTRGFLAYFTERITGAATITDGTWYRLSFIINGLEDVEAYLNGVQARARDGGLYGTPVDWNGKHTLPTAYIPTVLMTPTFVCQTDGTTDPIMYIDHVTVCQEL